MLTTKLARPAVLVTLVALSLSYAPAAHADGFKDKVKGVFSATGDAIKSTTRATGDVLKNSARATGDVLKESARVTGDVLAGTAKAGGAAAVATGDVLKSTAKVGEAACVATGDAVVGSARAVGGATEGALGMHHKAPTAAVAAGNAKADTPAVAAAPTRPAKALPVELEGARNVPFTPEAAMAEEDKAPRIATEANARSATLDSVKKQKTVALQPPEQPPVQKAAKPVAKVASKAAAQAPLTPPVSKSAKIEAKAAAIAPATASTEGTRITPPVMEDLTENVSPSWNDQQPVASSTAFASQYALRTTPLQPNMP